MIYDIIGLLVTGFVFALALTCLFIVADALVRLFCVALLLFFGR